MEYGLALIVLFAVVGWFVLRPVLTGTGGEHVEDERVTYVRARTLDLAFDRVIRLNTDGQVLEADRCRYEVQPGAVRMMVPGPVSTIS